MSKPKKPEAPALPELTLSDHYMGILKTALEFNSSIIAIATQVIAMDSSGHNRKTHKAVTAQINESFRKYQGHIDAANTRIVKQYFPKDVKEEGVEHDGSES